MQKLMTEAPLRKILQGVLCIGAFVAVVFLGAYGTRVKAQTTTSSVPPPIINTYVLESPTATFSWNEIASSTSYWAYVGTTPGSSDIHNSGSLGTKRTVTVTNIPLTGTIVWLRIWYINVAAGRWLFQDFGYGTVVADGTATTTSARTPITFTAVPDTIVLGDSTTLTWDAPRAVTCSASGDGWSGAKATSSSEVVSPTAFTTYTLDCEETNGASGSVLAAVNVINIPTTIVWVTPSPGSILPNSDQTFAWNEVRNATDYWVYMGSTVGAHDIFNTNSSIGNTTTTTVTAIPLDGRTVWLRIFYRVVGVWTSQDFSYQTGSFISFTATPDAIDEGMSSKLSWSAPTAISCEASGGWSGARATISSESVSPNVFTSYTLTCTKPDGTPGSVTVTVDVRRRTTTENTTTTSGLSVIPPSCSVLETSTVTFSWSEVTGATDYWVYMGSGRGESDIFNTNGSIGLVRTIDILGIPLDGRQVWLRIFYYVAGLWRSQDFLYVTLGGSCPVSAETTETTTTTTTTTTTAGGTTDVAALTLTVIPPPGTILDESTVTFTWSGATGATDYWVYMGSAVGESDIFNTNASIGAVPTVTVTDIPLDGRAVWLKIFYQIAGVWASQDFPYGTINFMTFTVSPTAIKEGESSTLTWAAPTADTCSAFGGWSGGKIPAGGSESVSPTTSTQYILTCSTVSGISSSIKRFVNVVHSIATVSTSTGLVVIPPPGSLLSTSDVLFSWSNVPEATDYWVYMGSTEGEHDIFNTNASIGTTRTVTVTGIPLDGRLVWLKIFYQVRGLWQGETFGYRTTGGILGSGATTTTNGGTTGDANPVITLAVNPTSIAAPGDLVTLFWSAPTDRICNATSTVPDSSWDGVKALVGDETIHASSTTIYTLTCSSAAGTRTETSVTVTFAGSRGVGSTLTVTPRPGSTLSSPSVTFSWTSTLSTAAYWVSLGTASGSGNVAPLRFIGSGRSATISNIPLTGSPVWLRIVSLDSSGRTSSQDFSYQTTTTTGTEGTTTTGGTTGGSTSGTDSVSGFTPRPGTTLGSSSVAFSWDPIRNVSAYWASVGTSAGGGNIFSLRYIGNRSSVTVNTIPLDGRPIWLRILYLDPASFLTKHTDVSYQTINMTGGT